MPRTGSSCHTYLLSWHFTSLLSLVSHIASSCQIDSPVTTGWKTKWAWNLPSQAPLLARSGRGSTPNGIRARECSRSAVARPAHQTITDWRANCARAYAQGRILDAQPLVPGLLAGVDFHEGLRVGTVWRSSQTLSAASWPSSGSRCCS
jgi:hypothetical protein